MCYVVCPDCEQVKMGTCACDQYFNQVCDNCIKKKLEVLDKILRDIREIKRGRKL